MKKRLYLLASASVIGLSTLVIPANSQTIAQPSSIHSVVPRPVQNADLDFELVNSTGYDIAAVYISPNDQESWGDNVLDSAFPNGASAKITFSPNAEAALWDLRIEWAEPYQDDPAVYWKALNLTEINRLTLKYDKESDVTSVVKE